MSIEIGVDIGGTFTDVVCRQPGRPAQILKLPTTRDDPGQAVLAAVRSLDKMGVLQGGQVSRFVHGTTVATNAVLERQGARVGLLTTEGFRDVLEIGRQFRQALYEVCLHPETPGFLAPRAFRGEVTERIDAKGQVVTPLDEAALLRAADDLVARGVQAIAIVFLFSFLNPVHEHRAAALLRQRHSGIAISISSEVDPAFREYERTAVTAFDAYIKPVVDGYLNRLQNGLTQAGVAAPLQIMQSRGGLAGAAVARERPVRLFLSGPAAGVMGACAVGARDGMDDLISIDIGGTTCDIALIEQGAPTIRTEGTIDGYPVRVSMIDINPIGAGGGSIAWLDGAGGLRVGPRSAGSEPGPACYGRGGDAATVTDASLLLGYLDPGYFAAGSVALHKDLARAAIGNGVAKPLGLTEAEAALGIHRVLNSQMAEGIRAVTVRRGHDPRGFALVALGGAGPLHAIALAEELGIRRILVPPHPGVLSAQGLLDARVEHEVTMAFGHALAALSPTDLVQAYQGIDDQARALIAREGLEPGSCTVGHYADVCFVGQSHYLGVPVDLTGPDPINAVYQAFLETHDRINGHRFEAPAKIVNLRTVHRAPGAKAGEHWEPPASGDKIEKTRRAVHLPGHDFAMDVAVLDRAAMTPGQTVIGPAIIEQADATTLLTGGWSALVAPSLTLILDQIIDRNIDRNIAPGMVEHDPH
ncbi:MAG: hydantoinase/oxoprolinase family protein [Proteobacteria bacterium]|nr:hydantoinase/oxoprolinase family protein [Pseudomonadota bacterium]